MAKYKCVNCGYSGKDFVFQLTEYTYCMATNEDEPEYESGVPSWVKNKCIGDGL